MNRRKIRFSVAVASTSLIHAAIFGPLMQTQNVPQKSRKAVEIAMVDLANPVSETKHPKPAQPIKAPTKTVPEKMKPKPKTTPKPKPVPKSEPAPKQNSVQPPEPPRSTPKEPVPQQPKVPRPEPDAKPTEPVPAAPTASTRRFEVQESYLAGIRRKIQMLLRYPMMARRLKLEGESLLSFTILVDGSISGLKLKRSSGHRVLDRQAISTITDAAPFEAPPEGRKIDIVIPVSFSLEKTGG